MLSEPLQSHSLLTLVVASYLGAVVYKDEARRVQGIALPSMVGEGHGRCDVE
jgi:hypothetical protein